MNNRLGLVDGSFGSVDGTLGLVDGTIGLVDGALDLLIKALTLEPEVAMLTVYHAGPLRSVSPTKFR